MEDNKVTKCVCQNVFFDEVRRIIKEKKICKLEELQDIKKVACGCKLCVPYINKIIDNEIKVI